MALAPLARAAALRIIPQLLPALRQTIHRACWPRASRLFRSRLLDSIFGLCSYPNCAAWDNDCGNVSGRSDLRDACWIGRFNRLLGNGRASASSPAFHNNCTASGRCDFSDCLPNALPIRRGEARRGLSKHLSRWSDHVIVCSWFGRHYGHFLV